MKKDPTVVVPPEGDISIPEFKTKYAFHFDTNQHVSESPFAAYFGSTDHGTRLHIPAAGKDRDDMNRAIEKDAQAKRCRALRAPQ
jgi:hypothetical protein